MSRHGFLVWVVLLGLVACITLACGSDPGSDPQQNSRTIQSITISPASADGQDYPDGKVPFVATGHYNSPPTTVTPLQANWGAESEQVVNGIETFGPANGAVLVGGTGVAQCAAGASGTYAVVAWNLQIPNVPANCNTINSIGEPGCDAVQGTAQLTCP